MVVGPLAVVGSTPAGPPAPAPARTRRGRPSPAHSCPAFPADNVWNTPITGLPVDADSATWLASMDAGSTDLHPTTGRRATRTSPTGSPGRSCRRGPPTLPIKFTYASESDPGPYPLSKSTPIERGSDRHALMVDPSSCTLDETWDTHDHANGNPRPARGHLEPDSDALRPAGWTSADAAGLPVLPGLVNYDEVASGTMDHAIRVTAQCTQQAYLWPARHQAGPGRPSCPPMVPASASPTFSFSALSCSATCQTVITTMQTYGPIVAENGSNWFFQGAAAPGGQPPRSTSSSRSRRASSSPSTSRA